MQTIVQFADNEQIYKECCHELSEALRIEKELKAKIESLKAEVIERAGGERLDYGIKVSYIKPKGSIDYKAIAQELDLDDQLLEKYRKEPSGYWVARNY